MGMDSLVIELINDKILKVALLLLYFQDSNELKTVIFGMLDVCLFF